MAAFVIPVGITLVRLVTGQLVKYGSKKAAQSAVKNIGGKVIKKTTEKTYKKAISPTQLKNNPTFKEKIKSMVGMQTKQSKTIPRPGRINKKSGVAVGKLNRAALENRGILKGTALTMAGSYAIDKMSDKDKDKKKKTSDKNPLPPQYAGYYKDGAKKKKEVITKKVTVASDKKKKGLSPFEKAFAKARANKQKTFKFKTKDGMKTFTTKLKESPKKVIVKKNKKNKTISV